VAHRIDEPAEDPRPEESVMDSRLEEPVKNSRPDDPAEYLVDEAEACAIIGGRKTPIHRSTFWRGIDSGRYPRPLKVAPNSNRWDRRKLTRVVENAASTHTRPATNAG